MQVDLDNISDDYEGQGHGTKVKVVILENVIFKVSNGLTCVDSL